MSSPSPRRTAAGRRLRWTAILLNVVLFGTGVYFQLHPRDRHDVWSAGGVAAIAALNTAALVLGRGAGKGHRVRERLRRISLMANTVLAAVGSLFAVAEGLREWEHAAIHGLALIVPPLVTLAALRRDSAGAEPRRAASL